MADEISPAAWRIRYADHSGNRYHFWAAEEDGAGHFSYSPVTPEQSSSGTYSGGEPQQGTLSASEAAELVTAVLALESATSAHARARMKGTGSFAICEGGGEERRFLVRRGARLGAFDQRVEPYRSPRQGD